MCISNHSSTSAKNENESTQSVQTAHVLKNDEENDARFKHTNVPENCGQKQVGNIGKLFETELKQHLFYIERKLDVLGEVCNHFLQFSYISFILSNFLCEIVI